MDKSKYSHGVVQGHPLFGCLKEIREDSLGFFDRCDREGDIVTFRLGHRKIHALHHPDLVREVMLSKYEIFVKRGIYSRLRPVFRNGLLTSMGDLWKKQRRTIQPAFTKRNIEAFAVTIDAESQRFRDEMLELADRGESVDAFREMLRLALRIMASTIFGDDIAGRHQEISDNVYYLNTYMKRCAYALLPPLTWLPTPANLQYRRSIGVLDKIIFELVEKRRRSGDLGEDFLGMLLSSKDPETGEEMSLRQIRDEAVTFFIAGHETTATALAWLFYLLDQNPEAKERFHREADAVQLQDGGLSLEKIKELDHLENIFLESMRQYPPIYINYREAAEDTMLGDFPVKKGESVYVSPYLMNKDSRFWEHPERFDPDRFTRGEGADKFVYFPFGVGPRACIGSHFALMEARIILAQLGRSVEFSYEGEATPIPEPLVTLKPRDPLMMKVRRRT